MSKKNKKNKRAQPEVSAFEAECAPPHSAPYVGPNGGFNVRRVINGWIITYYKPNTQNPMHGNYDEVVHICVEGELIPTLTTALVGAALLG